MAEDKLMSSKWFKLVVLIILISNQINNSSGSDFNTPDGRALLSANPKYFFPSDFPTSHGPACPSLVSSLSTNYKCRYYGQPIDNCDNPRVGTSVYISCNSGYEEPILQESRIRVCRNGKWDPSVPECYPIRSETFSGNSRPQFEEGVIYQNDCSPLFSSESTNVSCKHNGVHLKNCQNSRDGTTVFISCNSGYDEYSLRENPIRVCRNGKWNPSIPECYPIDGQTFSPTSGNYSPQSGNGVIHQSACPSLTSSETTNFKCKHNGVALKNCQNPSEGTTVFITCSLPYVEPSLQENPIRVCRNGKWNSDIPPCYSNPDTVPSATFPPSIYENNHHISGETPTNTFGNSNSPNGDGANYSGTCPPLTSSIHRKFDCYYYGTPVKDCLNPIHGTVASITCNPSYGESNNMLLCLNGHWNSEIPQCYPTGGEAPSQTSVNSSPNSGHQTVFGEIHFEPVSRGLQALKDIRQRLQLRL